MRVGSFGLEHPEFGEVAARLGFFRAKCGAERVDLAESHGGGFDVELAGLRQVGLLVVNVIYFEERGGAFAGSGREDGRVGERVALGVHVIARGADGFGADAQDRGLARRANPEMALVEQKIDAVLFELNRIGIGVWNALDDFNAADMNFEAARRALFGVNFSRDDDAGFLRQSFERFEGFRLFFQRDDALDDAGAVAKNREEEFSRFAQVVEPAANRDGLSGEVSGLFDVDDGHWGLGLLVHSIVRFIFAAVVDGCVIRNLRFFRAVALLLHIFFELVECSANLIERRCRVRLGF